MNKRLFNRSRRSFLLGLGGIGLANLLQQYKLPPLQAENLTTEHNKSNKSNLSLRRIAAAKGII